MVVRVFKTIQVVRFPGTVSALEGNSKDRRNPTLGVITLINLQDGFVATHDPRLSPAVAVTNTLDNPHPEGKLVLPSPYVYFRTA